MARLVDDSQARIRETIVTHMPKEAEITRIEFEGPRLAIYVKNVALLLEQSYVVTDIVNLLHKRVVIRSDPSIRHTETESERLIKGIVPTEAEITEINFDPTLGEVVIEAKKPGLAIGKDGSTLSEIIKTTSWRPRVLRAPPLPSKIIASTRHILHSESEERSRIFRDVGERIFRPRVTRTSRVFLTPLGGFHEVGRSSMLIETEESCVLLDCGVSAGANQPSTAYPRIDSDEFDIDKLDAVIISHAHLDHCLHPDSYVQLSDGEIAPIPDVATGQTVPAVNFNQTMKLDAISCIQRGALTAPQRMVEIRTRTRRLKTTLDHPFFTFSCGTPTTRLAKDLHVGDYVATVRRLDILGSRQPLPHIHGFPTRTDPILCQVIGYLLGDGTKAGWDYGQVVCTDKSISNLKTYSRLMRKKFRVKPSIKRISERNRLIVSSKRFREWLESIEPTLLVKSPERRIPKAICKSTRKEVARFLRGLYDAEGSVGHHHIVFTTSSPDLAHKTQLLLLRFGIISHLYDHDQKKSTFGGGAGYQLTIFDPASLKTFSKQIGFEDAEKARKLHALIKRVGGVFAPRMDLVPIDTETVMSLVEDLGLRRIDLRRLGFHYTHYERKRGHFPTRTELTKLLRDLLRIAKSGSKTNATSRIEYMMRLLESDVMWEPVAQVTERPSDCDKVYDLTVPGHSNYIANGIVVHNCGFVPFLFKYGFDGPVYCSEPTSVLMTLLQLDYLDVGNKEGAYAPYDQKDVREVVMHTIPVKYGVVTDVAPDIKLTLHNAGHIIGSSIVHLHIGEGLHNVVYSVDWSSPITVIDPAGQVQITRIGELIDRLMQEHKPTKGFVERVQNLEGWKTFAFDPSTCELKTVPITSFLRHPISEELYEVTTSTGRKALVTGSHSVFTVSNGQIAAAKVRELRKGDYLVGTGLIPNFASASPMIELDEREFRVFENDRAKLRQLLGKYRDDIKRKFPDREPEILRWVREHFERGAYRSAIAKKYHAKASRVRSIFRELGIDDSPRLKANLPKHFEITAQFSRFLGYFASEGSTQGNTVVITNYDEEVRADCLKTSEPIFNCRYFEDKREVRFHSRSLKKLLSLVGALGTAHTKRVPSIILSGPEANVCEFLRGYFEGDGSLRIRSKGCSISVSSKSELLLQDTAFLLLRLGIPVTFEYNRTSDMHIITIYGLDNLARFLEKVKIEEWSRALIAVNPKRHKNPLWNRTPIAALSPELQARLLKTAYRYAKSIGRDHLETLLQFGGENDALISHAPFIYDEVKSIRKVEPTRRYVYDLSVERYENFVGGFGFLFLHNTGDFKFARTMLLEPAACSFPRVETLIMESTYGAPDDVMSDRETVEGKLARIVNETAEKGGKILIPTLAVGRAQEIMLVLNSYMKNKQIKELPIYLEGMISEATAIHTAYPEYLARDLREQILYKDINPFQSDYFTNVDHPSDREKITAGDPAVILATSGMMEGGPAIDYFRYLAPDERNSLVFVSYQVEGTLGNRLKNGGREVSLMGRNGKVEAYKVNLRVESVEGFSGHSDRNQLFGFLKRISPRPSRVIVGHGERRKTDLFAQQVSRILKLRTIAPDIQETLRLR